MSTLASAPTITLTDLLTMRLILTWFINAAALLAVPYLMHSVSFSSAASALLAALVLGLINTLIRPILIVLTLPVTMLSLGLFIFIINGFMFWLVAQMIGGFHVTSFWAAVGGALLYSVISWALSTLLLKNNGNS
ncbi:MAG: putative membrane protein [Janthinobacterium sp.]